MLNFSYYHLFQAYGFNRWIVLPYVFIYFFFKEIKQYRCFWTLFISFISPCDQWQALKLVHIYHLYSYTFVEIVWFHKILIMVFKIYLDISFLQIAFLNSVFLVTHVNICKFCSFTFSVIDSLTLLLYLWACRSFQF